MEEQPFDFTTPITEDTELFAMYDCPNGITLTQFKAALDNGAAATVYPVNTQIDDYTNGNYDPWVVGHYGKEYGDNNTDGAYLYRKYLYPEDQAWGSGDNYSESTINNWLNTTYLNECSADIKGLAKQISLPNVNGSNSATMFLMSAGELLALSTSYAGGVVWDSWKERTGLTSPSTSANSGRVMSHGELINGNGNPWLTRTVMNGQNGVINIENDGATRVIGRDTAAGIVPACFIPKVSYDPSNPTLEGLRAALQAGDEDAFPVGTEIPDTWNGQSNPLIVAQYLDSSNNSRYDGAEGVILIRKYVEPTNQTFGGTAVYSASTIKNFLDTTYYNNCSEQTKSIISDISVDVNTGTSTYVSGKWFLMSGIEVGGGNNAGEGFFWDYWKQQTGLSSGSSAANPGRILKNRDGGAMIVWLRSRYNTINTQVCVINLSGQANAYAQPNATIGVLPACFIAKTSSAIQSGPITAQEYNDKNITAEAYNAKAITTNDFNNNAKGVL